MHSICFGTTTSKKLTVQIFFIDPMLDTFYA